MNTPIYNKLKELDSEKRIPFHMPGHKRTDFGAFFGIEKMDITEITDYDNLHEPEGIIRESMDLVKDIFKSTESWYLVGGSTLGILVSISSVCKPGDKILIGRNCHKAVYNCIRLLQLEAVYCYADISQKYDVCVDMKPEMVEKKLKENPEIKAVVLTSPTYEGVVSDIKGIKKTIQPYGIPLIVDEAHGAHFNFHDKFPESAVKRGADAVIQSIHKTLPSFTQTALLHLNGNLIDKDRVKKYWNIYQSTSPSYILMAGISRCLTFLEDNMCDSVSSGYMDEYVFRLTNLRKEIKKLKYIKLQEVDDISKIVLVVNDGKNLYDKLLNDYGIQLEMASVNYCIAMTSVGDKQVYYDRFIEALRELDTPENEYSGSYSPALVKAVVALNMYEADSCDNETVNIRDSIGHIAASNICFYPPGINLVNAGEVVTQEVIDVIKDGLGHGLSAIGVEKAADGSTLIKCVKQRTVL